MFNNYYDCENLCQYNYAETNLCLDCTYYKDCMNYIEKIISDYEASEALNRQLSKIEDGDFI